MVLVGAVVFTYLGVTQTNRPQAVGGPPAGRSMRRSADRFAKTRRRPARFGIYTATIWLLAFAAFGVLSFTVGWAWSWLALLAGAAAMMLTLARMLFGKG
jgi:fatty acid desaturase